MTKPSRRETLLQPTLGTHKAHQMQEQKIDEINKVNGGITSLVTFAVCTFAALILVLATANAYLKLSNDDCITTTIKNGNSTTTNTTCN